LLHGLGALGASEADSVLVSAPLALAAPLALRVREAEALGVIAIERERELELVSLCVPEPLAVMLRVGV
jgi:hypothetical protein